MANADDGEDLAIRLEILPGRGWRSTEHELEAEAAGIPWLVCKWGFLVLGVEGADGVERDGAVAEEHGSIVPEEKRGDVGDREDRHPDHAARLDARVGFHFSDEECVCVRDLLCLSLKV